MSDRGTEVIMPTTPLQPNTRPNPYVGPRPFTEEEKLYGRESEIQNLMNLFIAERILLLHSPSGAGKTSLIQAGLVPKLKDQKIRKGSREIGKFHVRPIIRVSQEPSAKIKKNSAYNRYIFSMLGSFESAFDKKEDQIPDDELISMSLSDYLKRRAKPKDVLYDIFIFDQFEEILTLDPTDLEAKHDFFKQVGKILEDRKRWALFTIREDFLASFEPYLFLIPTRFSNHFRLDFLGTEAACQAIQTPARRADVEFTDKAASQLVNNLRRVKLQSPDGSMTEQLGPYVEPVQLQVVCFRLWQNLAPDDQTIDEDNLTIVGDVNQSLAEYYAEQVSAVASQFKIEELVIRKWFNDKLITEGGIRSQVLMNINVSEGLPNQTISQFVDAHLVRAEKRRGLTWFELAHDRLVEPVRKDNMTWYESNLSPFERQAALWKDGRRSDYLLHGQVLEDAKNWAEAHDEILSIEEREFLDACLAAQAIEDAERRAKAMRHRQIIIVSILIAVIMALAASFSFIQWQKTGYALATATNAEGYALHQAQTATNAQGFAQQQAQTAVAAMKAISTLANPVVAQETKVAQVTGPLTVVISNVSINEGENSAFVPPDTKLTVTLDYFIQDKFCLNCFNVIQIGFVGEEPLQCIYQGIPEADGASGSAVIKIDAPSTLGEHSLMFDSVREYSCPAEWMSNLSEGTEKQIATIKVLSEEIKDAKGVSMVLVPEGEFIMGSDKGEDDEKPPHTVYLDAFYIDKYEVTNARYKACVDEGVCNVPREFSSSTRDSYYGNPQYDNYPVVNVDWEMANAFCGWRDAGLPTEAEWEKAASWDEKKQEKYVYPWGEGITCSLANYFDCRKKDTSVVGNYTDGKSPFGAYDMAGNVWEWVADWYTENYYSTYPRDQWPSNPTGPEYGVDRVLRGGSGGSYDHFLKSANRSYAYPATRNTQWLGFRCAHSVSADFP
jgi:formylglycine-generating enzyme required for sulfatase activity